MHTDIKPGNILLFSNLMANLSKILPHFPIYPESRLSDFDHSRQPNREFANRGAGTSGYVPSKQLSSHKIPGRMSAVGSDVFAIGSVIWDLMHLVQTALQQESAQADARLYGGEPAQAAVDTGSLRAGARGARRVRQPEPGGQSCESRCGVG